MERIKITFNKIINKLLNFGFKRTFFVHQSTDGEVKLVKVMGKYGSKSQATNDMIDVVTHVKNEYELLKKYNDTEN